MKESWHHLLRVTRAPAGLLLAAAIGLLAPQQTDDMLAFLADGSVLPSVLFQLTLAFLAFSAWFWARTALAAEYDLPDSSTGRAPGTQNSLANVSITGLNLLPRLLFLMAVLLGLAMALRQIGWVNLLVLLAWAGLVFWFINTRIGRLRGRDQRAERVLPALLVLRLPRIHRFLLRAPMGTSIAVGLLGLAGAAFGLGLATAFVTGLRPWAFGWMASLLPGPISLLTFLADR